MLDAVEEVVGQPARNQVAILFDWRGLVGLRARLPPERRRRATATGPRPCTGRCRPRAWGSTSCTPSADLSSATSWSWCPPSTSSPTRPSPRSTAAAEAGATVVVTYFSGIVDEHDHIRLGGYPGAFRDLLGVRIEEFLPLLAGESSRSTARRRPLAPTSGPRTCTSPAPRRSRRTSTGPPPGVPAVTRHEVGSGAAWYVAHAPRPARAPTAWSSACSPSPGSSALPGAPPGRRGRPAGSATGASLALRDQPQRRRRPPCRVHGHDLVRVATSPATWCVAARWRRRGAGGLMLAAQRRAQILAELEPRRDGARHRPRRACSASPT